MKKWLERIAKIILNFFLPTSPELSSLEEGLAKHGISILRTFPSQQKDYVVSLLSFEDPNVRTFIHEIKYRRNSTFASHIAPLLLEECVRMFEDECIGEYEKPILTWIPTRTHTFHERGFHHVHTLKNAVSAHDSDFFIHSFPILSYTRPQKRQTEMKSRQERIQNMEGAFRSNDEVRGRIIFVLDDVCTTGSTLLDAKRAFLEKGAKKVFLVSLAR